MDMFPFGAVVVINDVFGFDTHGCLNGFVGE
jgi:hypothetical protein